MEPEQPFSSTLFPSGCAVLSHFLSFVFPEMRTFFNMQNDPKVQVYASYVMCAIATRKENRRYSKPTQVP